MSSRFSELGTGITIGKKGALLKIRRKNRFDVGQMPRDQSAPPERDMSSASRDISRERGGVYNRFNPGYLTRVDRILSTWGASRTRTRGVNHLCRRGGGRRGGTPGTVTMGEKGMFCQRCRMKRGESRGRFESRVQRVVRFWRVGGATYNRGGDSSENGRKFWGGTWGETGCPGGGKMNRPQESVQGPDQKRARSARDRKVRGKIGGKVR